MLALLVLGSASLLFSCDKKGAATVYDYETLMTESSENRTITMMENGKRSYTFTAPLMEGYSMASNPYQEFRRGIHMTTFTDSLALEDATITANYAIYYERQKLWEAKGNVVIIKKNRQTGDTVVTGLTEIYTQQLFWNATTKKIYSNVDTKVLQPDGWHFGVGFDADEDLKNIHFRKYSSEMEFDMSQPEPSDESDEESEADVDTSAEDGEKGGASDAKVTPQRPAVTPTRPTTPVAEDRNISPLPAAGRPARPEAKEAPAERPAPVTPSMGGRPATLPVGGGEQPLTVGAGAMPLKPGEAKQGLRPGAVATPAGPGSRPQGAEQPPLNGGALRPGAQQAAGTVGEADAATESDSK